MDDTQTEDIQTEDRTVQFRALTQTRPDGLVTIRVEHPDCAGYVEVGLPSDASDEHKRDLEGMVFNFHDTISLILETLNTESDSMTEVQEDGSSITVSVESRTP